MTLAILRNYRRMVLSLTILGALTLVSVVQAEIIMLPWFAIGGGGNTESAAHDMTASFGQGQPVGVATSQQTILRAGFMLQPEPPLCGDQDGDGKVNILDAIIDLQIVAGRTTATPIQLILSDVDSDGEITVLDVIMTLQHLVGKEEITDCGPLDSH